MFIWVSLRCLLSGFTGFSTAFPSIRTLRFVLIWRLELNELNNITTIMIA